MKKNYNYSNMHNTKSLLKNIFIATLAMLFSFNTFSQSANNNKETIVKNLLTYNNGDVLFTQLLENTIKSVDSESKEKFRKEVEAKADKIKNEAIAYFMNKYSQNEIEVFLEEFAIADRNSKSEKFYVFHREWDTYKREFHIEFMKIYNSYRN